MIQAIPLLPSLSTVTINVMVLGLDPETVVPRVVSSYNEPVGPTVIRSLGGSPSPDRRDGRA